MEGLQTNILCGAHVSQALVTRGSWSWLTKSLACRWGQSSSGLTHAVSLPLASAWTESEQFFSGQAFGSCRISHFQLRLSNQPAHAHRAAQDDLHTMSLSLDGGFVSTP
jgi:hypothetical protein